MLLADDILDDVKNSDVAIVMKEVKVKFASNDVSIIEMPNTGAKIVTSLRLLF